MPEQPLPPLDLAWPAIVRGIYKQNAPGDARPFKKTISDGYFAAVLLKWPEQWQRQVLVLFPYDDEAWCRQARAVLEFEAACWERWCALQEALAAAGNAFCAPLWWGGSEHAAVVGETVVPTDGGEARLPYLLRPYVPFPSLRERALSDAELADLFERLRRDAEWVVGIGDLQSYLKTRSAAAPAPPPERWWTRTSAWLRARFQWKRSRFRWTPPDPVAASRDGAPHLEHFLSDGRLLVPTRWRPFHSHYASFGRLIDRSTDRAR